MKYFDGVNNLSELKKAYHKLAMQYHPDMGGDMEIMKKINEEHDKLFEILKANQNAAADADTTGKTYRTTESAEEFRDILDIIMPLDGIEVELCGAWLWIGGNTIVHKEVLKSAGCKWSQNKKMWYWYHKEDGVRWSRRKTTMRDIRTKYGSEVIVKAEERERIAG